MIRVRILGLMMLLVSVCAFSAGAVTTSASGAAPLCLRVEPGEIGFWKTSNCNTTGAPDVWINAQLLSRIQPGLWCARIDSLSEKLPTGAWFPEPNCTGAKTFAGNHLKVEVPEGPFYKVEGRGLEPGESRLLLAKATTAQVLSGTGLTVTCQNLTLPDPNHMQILGASAGNAGTSNEAIEYSECTSAGAALGSPCAVTKTIKTGPVVNTLGYSRPERMGPVLVLFEPEGANGSNTKPFVTLKFTGAGCSFPGGLPVFGRVIGEAYENGKPVEVNLEELGLETLHGGELKFTKVNPKTIWIEKNTELTTEKTKLEVAGVAGQLEGSSAVLVDSSNGPVDWGIFT